MVGMAIALTDGGMGDYWDDVEMYARNGLISAQATDLNELRRVSEEGAERPPYAPWGGMYDEFYGHKNNKGRQPGQEIGQERGPGTAQRGHHVEMLFGQFRHAADAAQ